MNFKQRTSSTKEGSAVYLRPHCYRMTFCSISGWFYRSYRWWRDSVVEGDTWTCTRKMDEERVWWLCLWIVSYPNIWCLCLERKDRNKKVQLKTFLRIKQPWNFRIFCFLLTFFFCYCFMKIPTFVKYEPSSFRKNRDFLFSIDFKQVSWQFLTEKKFREILALFTFPIAILCFTLCWYFSNKWQRCKKQVTSRLRHNDVIIPYGSISWRGQ